jgi:hypothetical protein
MHCACFQPLVGDLFCGPSEFPKKRLSGQLCVAALSQPAEQALGLRADQGIAFRMRNHRLEAGELEFVESLVEGGRDGEVGKFDQQIVFLVERVAAGVVADVLQVLKAEMEITARGDGEAAFESSLNFIPAFFYQFGNETMGWMGVGRGDDVGDAVGDGHFRHRAGDIERVWAVVKARKYVAMNVNHIFVRIAQARVDNNGRGEAEKQNLPTQNRIGPPIAMSRPEAV